jgi:cell division septation protein DedD
MSWRRFSSKATVESALAFFGGQSPGILDEMPAASREDRVQIADARPQPHGATSSTRRLNARQASVAFDPTGARKPTPAVRNRACAISDSSSPARRRERSRGPAAQHARLQRRPPDTAASVRSNPPRGFSNHLGHNENRLIFSRISNPAQQFPCAPKSIAIIVRW